jgi:preprotein translocase subunit SecD
MGKTARSAVDAGYNSAFSAIFDSNVCTFLTGAVLFQFGSGPVQNFAITLMVGIVSTLFTAVFITRVLFDLYTAKDRETLMI